VEESRSAIVLASLAAYMALCVGVGLWAMRRTRSTTDFFMAGRNLGPIVTGLAVFSSTLSGFGFVGGPGLVYSMGISSLWMVVCSSIGYCVSFFLLGKRLRLFAEVRDTISLPDAVAARYGSQTTRFLTAVAILLGVLGYLATQILAMATVLRDILASVEGVGDIGILACVAISCAVLVFYCVTGGIIASVYTDVVQGSIMIVAALLVFSAAANAFEGGFSGMSTTLLAHDREAISPWGTLGVLGCLSWYFLFGLGAAGQPHVVSKLMMSRSPRDSRGILPLTILGYGLSALLWISIGLVMRALVVGGLHPELSSADAAAPQFLQHYAPPLLAGVVFAGLFAAIMSTADGFLNIGAAAIVHDIPRALLGRSARRELLLARVATVGIAVVAALFALYSHYENARLVALLGAFGWGTFAAALVPTVAIGFNWKRATARAANTAILTSLIVNFGIELFGVSVPYGISGGAVALLVSLLLFFGISLASSPPTLDPDIEAIMDM
jgi:SSS family transporter